MSGIAVLGEIVSFKTTQDGCIRVVVEFNEVNKASFLEHFDVTNLVAVAKVDEQNLKGG